MSLPHSDPTRLADVERQQAEHGAEVRAFRHEVESLRGDVGGMRRDLQDFIRNQRIPLGSIASAASVVILVLGAFGTLALSSLGDTIDDLSASSEARLSQFTTQSLERDTQHQEALNLLRAQVLGILTSRYTREDARSDYDKLDQTLQREMRLLDDTTAAKIAEVKSGLESLRSMVLSHQLDGHPKSAADKLEAILHALEVRITTLENAKILTP